MTHAALVEVAASWLAKRRCFVLAEFAPGTCREIPDAIGWNPRGVSILIECKASRSDFLADKLKPSRYPSEGMGQLRYYLAPSGLLAPEDMPETWGLLEVNGRGVKEMFGAIQRVRYDQNAEIRLLLGAARRLSNYETRPAIPKYVDVIAAMYEHERPHEIAQPSLMDYATPTPPDEVE